MRVLNIHLDHLVYLREAVRAPSWSEAAKRLRMSQPALSQSLHELEKRIGLPLFERSGRKQKLTPMGEEVLRFAERMLAESEAMSGRLEALHRGEAGQLRVGMIDAACLYLLPEAVRNFQEQCPEIDMYLSVAGSDRLLQRLHEFDLDLAIVVSHEGHNPQRRAADSVPLEETLSVVPLYREPLYLVRPESYRGRPADGKGADDWVLYPGHSHTRGVIDAALRTRNMQPRIAVESGNPEVLRQMVAMGFGWSVLPEEVLRRDPTGIERVDEEPLAYRAVVAVRRRGAPDDARVDRLLEFAAEALRARH